MEARLRILHLEDKADDAVLVKTVLVDGGLACDIDVATTRDEYLLLLGASRFDLILSDSGIPGFDGLTALALAQRQHPETPFIFVSGAPVAGSPGGALSSGGARCILKTELDRLAPVIKHTLQSTPPRTLPRSPAEQLISVVQELSLARDLATIMAIVRRAARELTGADGATFVLRDGDLCHYAEENAIGRLWKGKRFPLTTCISGWTMLNRQSAVIEDIYSDPRIPVDAYRPTFVKSLAMVPIRITAPVGAIGNYWASRHRATEEEVKLLQALADSTSIAMENVQLYGEMEQRVRDRTSQLEATNRELEAFSYSVSHDLVAPLRSIKGFSRLLQQNFGDVLNDDARDYLQRIIHSTERMDQLIDDLLRLSRIVQTEVTKEAVDLTSMAREIVAELEATSPEHRVEVTIEENVTAEGDPRLLRVVLENLFSNAWKYTARRSCPRVAFGRTLDQGNRIYYVEDNGAGFDMAYAHRLFSPFQRLHPDAEFPGNGVGLATVQRIIHKHNGRIWATANLGSGATFNFTLP